MFPLFPNNLSFSALRTPLYYQQALNNMVNLDALSSMLMLSQEQALRSQLIAMSQMRAQMFQAALKSQLIQASTDLRKDDSLSLQSSDSGSPVMSLPPTDSIKTDSSVPSKDIATKADPSNLNFVKAQLEEMIHFILDNVGKLEQAEMERVRRKYAQNVYLIPIFDILVAKYTPVKKHREDIIRYVIRKALKYLKQETIEKNKVYGKRAYAILCKKYFQFKAQELENSGINIEDEKELIEFLLPYRKNSKNRTMNANFTAEIFSSKEFCQDYKKFLGTFDSMIKDDNKKKIQKLISLAEECILNNCPEKIKRCTRLPWLQAWVEKTREISFSLLNNENEEDGEIREKKVKTSCSENVPVKSVSN